ncbi:MAG: tRNA (adenosine(37)-N6)-dimethylallyltransferase MiaA [Candidatus Omnitrophota bacterium]|nr:tRNA (adenosine(37)-N6)-dimethylallyltransferase MiaA [Candidatus Omnitrophota bacterium]
MLNKVLFLVGPTAVGKTGVALELSKKIPLEVISCDSMQIYKELNIISNKPQQKILKRMPHHLINVVSVKREYNVADFREQALKAIKAIHKKDKIPLIVGGSGLYMSLILDGIFRGAKKDLQFRSLLNQQAKIYGSLYLHNRLKKIDPQAAQIIHPNDLKRIIRALEVYELTKQPISNLKSERKGIWGKFDIQIFGLLCEREELHNRINARVEIMFRAGLLKEIKAVLKKTLSLTSSYCLGIREIKGYFAGQYDLAEAKRLIKQNSRRYAKRQMTWFRKDKRINWIKITNDDTPKNIAKRILAKIE